MLPGVGFESLMGGGAGLPLGEFMEGGYFLGTIEIAGTEYALIVAEKSGGEASSLAWGPTVVTGATSEENGVTNTAAIVAASGSHPAGEFCAGLSLNGYSDWYLPALGELQLILGNNARLPSAEQFGPSSSTRYWSSTEYADFGARAVSVSGSVAGTFKSYTYNIRAVRRVAL